MKIHWCLALALSAVLPGPRLGPVDRPTLGSDDVTDSASLPAPGSARLRLDDTHEGMWTHGVAGSQGQASVRPSPRPSSPMPDGTLASADPVTDESPASWLDGTLELMNQIGLLCSPSGCDSLEDD